MNFEITSKVYFWFVLVAVLAVLLIDAFTGRSIYMSGVTIPKVTLAFIIFGVIIRIGILVMLFMRKGPFKLFVYLWGAMFIVSGAAGVLALILRDVEVDYYRLISKLLFLAVGLLLVIPVRRVVKNA